MVEIADPINKDNITVYCWSCSPSHKITINSFWDDDVTEIDWTVLPTTWKKRLKMIWNIIKGKEVHYDDLWITLSQVEELSEALKNEAERFKKTEYYIGNYSKE